MNKNDEVFLDLQVVRSPLDWVSKQSFTEVDFPKSDFFPFYQNIYVIKIGPLLCPQAQKRKR